MFCEKCGNKLPNDAEFCNKCGTKLEVSSSKKSPTVTPSTEQAPIGYGGNDIIKCGNCEYIGAGEPARTITGKVLAWLCIFIAWPITLIYFMTTHKYRCPKCKSTFVGVKNKDGIFVGQRGGSGKWVMVILVILISIAVFSVLTGIVLVNVTSYINKGKDAAIKGNLSIIMTSGAVYYDANHSYTDFCTSDGYSTPATATDTASSSTTIKNCTDTHFCACSTLKATIGDTYCVDDSGYGKETSTNCSTRCDYLGSCSD